MDDEILKTVESMLGKDIKIVDCEKTSSVREEEILLINGIPVQLEGSDGDAIKSALMTGQVPPCDLLNQLLYRAGILRQPVHLETSLSVKSSLIRKEEVTIARNGRILDERTSETHEDNIYTSSCKEIWEPVNKLGGGGGILKNIIPIPVMDDRRCLDGDGQAFLLTMPPSGPPAPPPPQQKSIIIQNSTSNLSSSSSLEDAAPIILPSSSAAAKSSSSSTSSSNSSSSTSVSTNNTTTTGKSSIFTDCSASSLLTSPLKRPLQQPPAPPDDDDFVNDSIGKNLLNCVSYDSGNGDLFNSLSQSQFLPTVTLATMVVATTTPNSNSISSCYDFLSSDETDFIHTKSLPISKEPSTDLMLPTIFGTVASDQCPKDIINRRGFPQTVGSCSTKSIDKSHQSHHPTLSTTPNIDYHQQPAIAPLAHQHHNQQQQQQHHHQQQQQHQHHQQYHQSSSSSSSLENDDNALVYRDGYLISGPLDTLIQHMVPTNDYYPDRSYLFAFLLSARLFIRPHELLAKICQLCDEQNFNNCRLPSKESTAAADHAAADHQHHHHHHQHHHHLSKLTNQQASFTDVAVNSDSDSSIAYNSDCCRKLRAFAQHFVQLLAEWIDTFPYDFRDERLMQHVRSMTRKCISIDNALRKDVSAILQNLLQRLTVLEKYEEFLVSLSRGGGGIDTTDSTSSLPTSSQSGTTTKSSSSVLTIQNNLHSDSNQSHHHYHQPGGGGQHQPLLIGQPLNNSSSSSLPQSASFDISELCSSPTLLAHQLTHIELERLSYIGPEEFVQAFAKENPHLEQSFSDMKKTRNLESYVQWFNRLSYLVATEIVKHPKKKQRVRIVEYWIETARECFNIGNFNSLMAIIAGLNMSPISRLKKTWAKVQSAKFSVLEHQMDPSSNFNSYRSTLKAAMWRSAGATDERERIVIPFFSLLVKDLYFLNEGCSNKLVNGHINFEKFWQLAKQVTEFIAWKQVTCPFEKLPKVIMFLQTNNVLNENTLAMASFECEPPDNNHEKDRYKSLKSEQLQQQ